MKLQVRDFAASFGIEVDEMSQSLVYLISEKALEIDVVLGSELRNLYLKVISKIQADEQVIGSRGRTEVWLNGWAENLEEFRESNGYIKSLTPRFVRSGLPIRWNGKSFISKNEDFELEGYNLVVWSASD